MAETYPNQKKKKGRLKTALLSIKGVLILTFTEPLQLTMLEHERKALESYKDITGSSYNFIIEQSIKYYIANKPQITAPAAPKTASKVRKRHGVHFKNIVKLFLQGW